MKKLINSHGNITYVEKDRPSYLKGMSHYFDYEKVDTPFTEGQTVYNRKGDEFVYLTRLAYVNEFGNRIVVDRITRKDGKTVSTKNNLYDYNPRA